jgi:C4-dicarboxylate-specific signal transduction histidine kinase
VSDEEPPHLLVRDNGPGLDSATAAQIFEPFFTTKAPESGTGLGLATCLRLAEQAGARLSVRETGPGGTTFALSLPVVAEP